VCRSFILHCRVLVASALPGRLHSAVPECFFCVPCRGVYAQCHVRVHVSTAASGSLFPVPCRIACARCFAGVPVFKAVPGFLCPVLCRSVCVCVCVCVNCHARLLVISAVPEGLSSAVQECLPPLLAGVLVSCAVPGALPECWCPVLCECLCPAP
jgi:hypothetical protein